MSNQKGLRAGYLAGLVVGLVLATGTAHARVSTERPGSILIFPKVTNTSDTVIHIANTTNSTRFARCFYVDGAPFPDGTPRWQVTDFNLVLTRQQPTHWLAGRGRPVNPNDDIDGLDPGPVPPIPPGFTGALVCVEVDDGGVPLGGDALKGDALVGDLDGGLDIASKYNAIAIPAGPDGPDRGPTTANQLLLNDLEYSACPGGFHFNFIGDGAADEVIEALGNGASQVSTNLTIVPCSMDFERLVPSSVTIDFQIRNEFEQLSGSSTTIECWGSFALADIVGLPITAALLGSDFAYAQVSVPAGVPNPGVLAIANVQRADGNGNASTAATNLHFFNNDDANNVNAVIRLSDE